ncbi:MAG: Type 1 glutamine amidotransferase-like domain-containing protein [Candidatus Dormibacteria bacterium]
MRCLLLGSGEFESWVADAERAALAGASGDGTVAVLATASAPEGEGTFERWNQLGAAHYREMGVPVTVLRVRDRDDAFRSEFAQAAGRCSLVFFSGGDPEYLARTLEATPLWDAVVSSLARGASYGGCSAGAMVVGSPRQRGSSRGRFRYSGGLGLFPEDVFGVHWDSPLMRLMRPRMLRRVPPGCRLLGIAERTAILAQPEGWRVFGAGRVELRSDGVGRWFGPGELIPIQTPPNPPPERT